MPYQPYPQPQGPPSATHKSESSSTQSQSTESEPRGQSGDGHQTSAPTPPGSCGRSFQPSSGPARNTFKSQRDEEDQENRDYQERNGQTTTNNRPEGGDSYADTVKGGQRKTFWRQQRNLPRPWSEGNSENHKFQTKRFKPAFEPHTDSPIDEHEENGSHEQGDDRPSPFNSQRPPSPKQIVSVEQNDRSPPRKNESQNDMNAQEWPPKLRLRSSTDSREDRPLPRWHPSRRRPSSPRRSPPPTRRPSPPPWRKRGHSRSRSPSPPSSQKSSVDVRKRLGTKNAAQKSGPKQKLKFPKGGKAKKGKKAGPVLGELPIDTENEKKINKRAQRFQSSMESFNRSSPSILSTLNASLYNDKDEEELDWSKFHVVGTCQDLKKNYYRLTTAPDPSTVRPREVLMKSLTMIKDHWKANQDDYRYVCEQFKSIRQDLTVQGIRDEFTAEVYETHARIALEKGDREEFNQCQTQLKSLYDNNVDGNIIEFTSYRLLYHLLTNSVLDYSTDILKLKEQQKQTVPIKHALRLCSAWALSNYHTFFQLYLCAPNMSGYLIDLFVKRERVAAIKVMIKSYRPTLPVAFIQSELGFTDEEECNKFLLEIGATLTAQGAKVDCRVALTEV
ncbi:hypothetical protein QZH41_019341 [Actinostola sp. cb2023]|nr:hypothetical protein QZH41_019341 [Actinostola sp. cb2023]